MYTYFVVYLHMTKRKKTMNFGKFKDGNTHTYWVNKKSGTIHMVSAEYAKYWGNLKLTMSTLNLPYERMYFTKGSDAGAVDRFLKNYEFICEKPTNEFWVNVLANKKLKNEFTWGRKTNGRLGISKDEFFSKVKGY